MSAYKAPDFNERARLAAEAKQKAIDKLRSKPPVDEAVVAARAAARAAREAREADKRAAKEAEREAEKQRIQAEKDRIAAEEAEALAKKKTIAIPTAAELKAARDARYAARKARK